MLNTILLDEVELEIRQQNGSASQLSSNVMIIHIVSL